MQHSLYQLKKSPTFFKRTAVQVATFTSYLEKLAQPQNQNENNNNDTNNNAFTKFSDRISQSYIEEKESRSKNDQNFIHLTDIGPSTEREDVNVSDFKQRTFINKKRVDNNLYNSETIINNKEKLVEKCLICCANPPNAVIMECGHGGICCECALDICKNNCECHLCRKNITSFLQLELLKNNQNHLELFVKILSETFVQN